MTRPERRLLQLDVPRAIVALLLLAGLGALGYFVLLPGGRAEGASPAVMLETPAGANGASPGVHPGSLARDFEASGLEGVRSRLSDLRGRPVVINFWATWCTSCLAEMPALERQRADHEAQGLAIVAVNVGEGTSGARRFVDSLELFDFVIAMDPTLAVADAYAVRGLPHSVFIDADGLIEAEYRGQLDDATMAEYVEAAIAGVPGGEPPFRPRFVTTVPRAHVLEVVTSDALGAATFASQRFRCDDDYCGEAIVEEVRDVGGVRSAERDAGATPPALSVTYDEALIDLETLVERVAAALRSHEDPLYTRELEIRFVD